MKSKYIFPAVLFSLAATSSIIAQNSEEPPFASLPAQSIYYEVPYRLVLNRDPSGYSLELDDGSLWRVTDQASARSVQMWFPNDPVVIHPCLVSWGGSKFYIINERLNSTANVELSYGSVVGSAQHNMISYIDYARSELQLQDGTGMTSYWYVDRSDARKLHSWQPYQTIIIGSNTNCYAGWFSSSPYILINVDRNEYIKASIQ